MFLQDHQQGLVRLPRLTGEHYFAVVANEGYTDGVLASTMSGFKYALRRLIVEEGQIHDWFIPRRIKVVAPGPAVLQRVRDHIAQEKDHLRLREVTSNVSDYYGITKKPPPGWTFTSKKTKGPRILEAGGRFFKWDGKGTILEAFGPRINLKHHIMDEYSLGKDTGWGPSTAEVSDSPEFAMFRGWKGGDGEKLRVEHVNENWVTPLARDVPAFYFVVLEQFPELTEPFVAERKEKDRLEEEARDERWAAFKREEAEREATRVQSLGAWFTESLENNIEGANSPSKG